MLLLCIINKSQHSRQEEEEGEQCIVVYSTQPTRALLYSTLLYCCTIATAIQGTLKAQLVLYTHRIQQHQLILKAAIVTYDTVLFTFITPLSDDMTSKISPFLFLLFIYSMPELKWRKKKNLLYRCNISHHRTH